MNKILAIVLLIVAVICFGLAIAMKSEASLSPAIIGVICGGAIIGGAIRNKKK